MDVLNFTPLNNKSIRVMYSHRDPSSRKSGTANIFIKVHFLSLILVEFIGSLIRNSLNLSPKSIQEIMNIYHIGPYI